MSGKAALFCGALVVAVTLSMAGEVGAKSEIDFSFLADLVRKVADFETKEDDAAEGIYVQLKSHIDISTPCRKATNNYWDSIDWDLPLGDIAKPMELLWPQKMYDAIGKFPISGVTGGNTHSLGSYTSCKDVNATLKYDLPWYGKYCFLERTQLRERPVQPSPVESRIGICVPDVCTDADVRTAIAEHNKLPLQDPDAGYTRYELIECPTNDIKEVPLDGYDYLVYALLGLFAFLSVIGTLFDLFLRKVQSDTANETLPPVGIIPQAILCFSTYSSFGKLMDCTAPVAKDYMSSLNGIRFISFTWVMVHHVYQFVTEKMAVQNANQFNAELQSGFLFRPVLNILASDTFFFVSGLVMAYTILKDLERTKSTAGAVLGVPLAYLRRFMRLTGLYIMVLNFHNTLYKFFDIGPLSMVQITVDTCRANFWKNVLYINNFASTWGVDWCLPHTWYLDVEMQIFLFALPFVVIPMWIASRRRGSRAETSEATVTVGDKLAVGYALGAAALFFVISFIYEAVAQGDLDPITARPMDVTGEYFHHYYTMPWNRAQTYIVGIACGYVMHMYRNRDGPEIPIWLNLTLWLAAFGVGCACAYGVDSNGAKVAGIDGSVAGAVAYDSFVRIMWPLALSWVVYACEKGYGGVVYEFLTWEAFGPLSRMSYCLFLLHFSVMDVIFANITYPVDFGHFLGAMLMSTLLLVNVLVCTLVCTFLEVPLRSIQKWFFGVVDLVTGRDSTTKKIFKAAVDQSMHKKAAE